MPEARPKVIEVPLHVDDRGVVYGAFDRMHEAGIKRTYVVENHQSNFVRAWHGHRKADTYIHVISGVAKIAAANMDDHKDVMVVTLTAHKPSLFLVPGGFYNGAQNLVLGTRLLIYSTLTMEEVKQDNFRLTWDAIRPDIWEAQYR
jgi:dTDP-4-dehydrorhamnose 3,5-epimerase-like enzyme